MQGSIWKRSFCSRKESPNDVFDHDESLYNLNQWQSGHEVLSPNVRSAVWTGT